MDLMFAFLLATVLLVAAWRGPRLVTLALSAVTFAVTLAIYLHHATDRLALSF